MRRCWRATCCRFRRSKWCACVGAALGADACENGAQARKHIGAALTVRSCRSLLSCIPQADFEASPRWTATELFFWRLLSQQLLGSFPTDADAAAAFARLAAQKQQGQLARGYSLFLKTRVGPWLVARADAAAVAAAAKRKGGGGGGDAEQARFDTLLRRLHTAEQTLGRSQGAVLAK